MEAVGAYIMRLVCACLICGILQSVYPKGSTREILKILCALFIAFTALSPVYQLDFSGFTSYFSEIRDVADAAAEDGRDLACEEYFSIIKNQTETYILDKAAQLNLCLEVEIKQDIDSGVPVEVILRGNVPPYGRRQLTDYISQTLGIGKEHQQWIG